MTDAIALATLKHLLSNGSRVITKTPVATLDGKILATEVYDLNRDNRPDIIASLKGGRVCALTLEGVQVFRTVEVRPPIWNQVLKNCNMQSGYQ